MTRPLPKCPVIGLVGGIGSGKSAVAAALARRGGCVVAGDPLGHEALRQPGIRAQVAARWGRGVLGADGEVNRRALGDVVFADPKARADLEALVHPWITRRLREQVMAARLDPECRFVVLDAAIMIEAGWESVCDLVVFVDAPRTERAARVASQRGWSEADLTVRERAQLPLDAKVARADDTIDNGGSPRDLDTGVDALLARWGICGNELTAVSGARAGTSGRGGE